MHNSYRTDIVSSSYTFGRSACKIGAKKCRCVFLFSTTRLFVMSAAERKLIKQTIVDFSAAYPGQALGMRRVRSELVERGSVFSDPRWNDEMKQIIRDVMEEIVDLRIHGAIQIER